MIYLDNAATSWPKPKVVIKAMVDFLERAGGNPGRSGHLLSIEAGRIIYHTRETVARFFNTDNPSRVIFTQNATSAINTVLHGLLKPGDRVITTSIEHNAVMRPLRYLEGKGIILSQIPCDNRGFLNLEEFKKSISVNTKLVIVNQANNVNGAILPLKEISSLVREYNSLLMVDTAQTAGFLPIDMENYGIDLLIFTGHKNLLGPPGVGGFIIGPRVNHSLIEPYMQGGTGSNSELENQPDFLPDKFESGTLNGVGIAGLGAGISYLETIGLEQIQAHKLELIKILIENLSEIPNLTLYHPNNLEKTAPLLSFTLKKQQVSEVGYYLSEEYGIMTRIGLHCAPAVHRTIGTFPQGTIRLSPGIFTTKKEILSTIKAIREIARR